MGSSQQHGFVVEDLLKKEVDRYAAHQGVSPPQINSRYTAKFDIPSHRDPYGKALPTSVKTSRFVGPKTLVCLSDAVRIAGLGEVEKMRLLVALYRQDGADKVFSEVREYIVYAEEWRAIMGEAPVELIEDFHLALKEPDHKKARLVAREWKRRMAEEYPSAMRWNPKIDSKNQRRLQCSVRLEDIEANILDKSRIRVFGQPFKIPGSAPRPAYLKTQGRHLWGDGICLPFKIASPPRARVKKADAAVVEDAQQVPASGRRPSRSMV